MLKQTLKDRNQRLDASIQKLRKIEMRLERTDSNASEIQKTSEEAENEVKETQKDLVEITDSTRHLKELKVKQTENIHKMRKTIGVKKMDVHGSVSAISNLNSKIKNFDEISLKQKEIIYAYDFEVTQLERKLEHASGKRSVQETKHFTDKIDELKEKLEKEKQQNSMIQRQVKKLEELLRSSTREAEKIQGEVEKEKTKIVELKLECESITCEIQSTTGAQSKVSVQHDELKLEVNRLKGALLDIADHVFQLENNKTQLALSEKERLLEIKLNNDMDKARLKIENEELQKLNMDVKDRISKTEVLKCRYKVVADKLPTVDGEEASQAYFIIKVAQERAEIEAKGNKLNEQIIRSEKEIVKLENTLNHLTGRNTKYRESLKPSDGTGPEAQMKKKLKQQLKICSDDLCKKKCHLRDLQVRSEQIQQTLKETVAKIDLYENQSTKKKYEIMDSTTRLETQMKSLDKKRLMFEKLVQSWNDKTGKVKTPEETEIETNTIKREIKSIMFIISDLIQEQPHIEETIRQVFERNKLEYNTLIKYKRSSSNRSTPRPLSSSRKRLVRRNSNLSRHSDRSDASSKSQASIVNLTLER